MADVRGRTRIDERLLARERRHALRRRSRVVTERDPVRVVVPPERLVQGAGARHAAGRDHRDLLRLAGVEIERGK